MSTLTEARHTGAYLGSVVDKQLCFETGTVKSGQKLAAGQVIELDNDGKIVAKSADTDTDGVVTEAVGILHQAVDASATGADADVPDQVYLARLATVKDDVVVYPEGAKAETVASLAKLHIRPR